LLIAHNIIVALSSNFCTPTYLSCSCYFSDCCKTIYSSYCHFPSSNYCSLTYVWYCSFSFMYLLYFNRYIQIKNCICGVMVTTDQIMCPNGTTCLPADSLFSEPALCKFYSGCWSRTKWTSSHQNSFCSRHDIAEHLLIWS
jgi:hypothetical protein